MLGCASPASALPYRSKRRAPSRERRDRCEGSSAATPSNRPSLRRAGHTLPCPCRPVRAAARGCRHRVGVRRGPRWSQRPAWARRWADRPGIDRYLSALQRRALLPVAPPPQVAGARSAASHADRSSLVRVSARPRSGESSASSLDDWDAIGNEENWTLVKRGDGRGIGHRRTCVGATGWLALALVIAVLLRNYAPYATDAPDAPDA